MAHNDRGVCEVAIEKRGKGIIGVSTHDSVTDVKQVSDLAPPLFSLTRGQHQEDAMLCDGRNLKNINGLLENVKLGSSVLVEVIK